MGDGGAENAAGVVESVQRDLAGAALVFLENVGARAQGQDEGRPDVRRSQLDQLFDEDSPSGVGVDGFAHDRLEDPDSAS